VPWEMLCSLCSDSSSVSRSPSFRFVIDIHFICSTRFMMIMMTSGSDVVLSQLNVDRFWNFPTHIIFDMIHSLSLTTFAQSLPRRLSTIVTRSSYIFLIVNLWLELSVYFLSSKNFVKNILILFGSSISTVTQLLCSKRFLFRFFIDLVTEQCQV
jgi:hypothetical protein